MIQEAALPPIDRGLRDQDRAARRRAPATTPIASARASGDTLPYVRGSIIVKFKDDATRGGITAATAQVAGTIADRSSWADFDIVDIPTDADPEAAAAAMRARPDVEYAQPRYRNHAMARPNDTLYAQSMELPRDRHGARVGHPARRVGGHHRRRARQRHGVPNRARCATTRASRSG